MQSGSVFGTGRQAALSSERAINQSRKTRSQSWPLAPFSAHAYLFSIAPPRPLTLTPRLQPSFECVYQFSRTKDTPWHGRENCSFARPSSIVIHEGPSKRCNWPTS